MNIITCKEKYTEKRYDENIEGFFYTDINDICTIYKTNVCVYPRFDDIEAELLLLKADKELDKEQMIDALLHFKEDSPELVKKNKEDFEKFLNNLKNKEEEYVDKKAFYKDIGRGKLREGFNEYLRAEYRILLNFSKSKENLPLSIILFLAIRLVNLSNILWVPPKLSMGVLQEAILFERLLEKP